MLQATTFLKKEVREDSLLFGQYLSLFKIATAVVRDYVAVTPDSPFQLGKTFFFLGVITCARPEAAASLSNTKQ